MSHRISKHRLKHDEFAEDMLRTVNFIKRYSTEVLAVAVGLLVIVVGLVFISQNRAKSEQQAGQMLNSAHGALLAGSPAQAQEGYKEISSRFGSTAAGQEAKVYLANLSFQQRNYEEAIKLYRECLKSNPRNPILLSAAMTGVAACLEQQGDLPGAAGQYLAAAKRLSKEEHLAASALLEAGRCYTQAGMAESARQAYQKMIDDYPTNPKVPEAKAAMQMIPAS